MSQVETLHTRAMDLAEEAFVAQKKGDEERALSLFHKALELEQRAAELLPLGRDAEPTRSILYRSAAALAYHSKDYETAERMIASGLAGFPAPEIKEELKNLYEDIDFMRHLSVRGLALDKNQWFMSIYGNATRFGGTAADQLMMRLDRVSSLFYRTVERLLKLPYRKSGGVTREIKEQYGLYISAFHPRSFAVSFQVGSPDPQYKLFPGAEKAKVVEPSLVVDEVMRCFELFEGSNSDELRQRFDDENYYENFTGLARQLAPDGEDIKLVGFTSVRGGEEKPVALRKSRKQLRQQEGSVSQSTLPEIASKVSLCGLLMHAHTPLKGEYGIVKLIEKDSKHEYSINVPISIMKDVVQPFYEEEVTILGYKEEGKVYLEEIYPLSQ